MAPQGERKLGGYVGVKRVEGKTAEQAASDHETRAEVDAALAFLETLSRESATIRRSTSTPSIATPPTTTV
jgi:hypothetical protein